MRDSKDLTTILNAVSATGVGNAQLIGSFRNNILVLSTTGMGAGDTITVKIQGSIANTVPTFSSAKSSTNLWDYVQVIDLEDGSSIDGDTGITFSDANDVRQVEVNINLLKYVNVEVTAISDSNTSVSASLKIGDNK